METQKSLFTEKITSRDSVIGAWIITFDDIEKNIALIKEKEKIISINSSNSEISKDKKNKFWKILNPLIPCLTKTKRKLPH